MLKIRIVLIFLSFAWVQGTLFSQNSTNSPYTRYGYGQVADPAFGSQRGMGSIGYGLRDSRTINTKNPAAFSSVDSMTFMFDMGVSFQMGWFDDGSQKNKKNNGNVDYIAMQFPVYKKLGMGLGFKQLSNVGYKFGTALNTETGSFATSQGTGGLDQFYGALSYEIADRLSLGFSMGYLFGDIQHDILYSNSISQSRSEMYSDTLRTNGLVYDVGLQYRHQLDKNSSLLFGLVYSPKIKVNQKLMTGSAIYNSSSVELADSTYGGFGAEMPETMGVGITYNKRHKYTVGVDYQLQRWGDVAHCRINGTAFESDEFKNRNKISIGGEYIPDYRSRNYLNVIAYRFGGYYSDSYIKVKGAGYNEYGASLGFGFPMLDGRSLLNLSFEYARVQPETVNPLVSEQYFKCTLSYTFNELWFFKRKVQ